MEAVGVVASIAQLVQVTQALYGTLTAPKENRMYHRDLADKIRKGVDQIETLVNQYPDRANVAELNELLDGMGHDMRNLLNRIDRIRKRREGGKGNLKTTMIEWWKAGDIKQELERIDKKVADCYQRFSVGAFAHISNQQHATDQAIMQLRQQNEELQTMLKSINAKMAVLVTDPAKVSDAMKLQEMSTPEIKTALNKASKDLGRDTIADQEAEYLRTKIYVLGEELAKRESQLASGGASAGSPTIKVEQSEGAKATASKSFLRPSKAYPESASHIPRTGDPSEEIQDAIQETMRLTRLLQKSGPDVSPDELADALFDLELALGDLGWDEEAAKIGEWGVKATRALVVKEPERYTPMLARSIANWSSRLSACGQYQEALAHCEEALEIWRKLTTDRPDAYLPDLALSLNNWSNRLSNVGRHEESFFAIERAVEIYRKLAAFGPDAYLPELARSLNNWSVHLGEFARHGEALAAIEEAVNIRRKLAADRPDAYLPVLAISLNNWSGHLSDFGRDREALAALEEATKIYRNLATDRPDAYLPDLALSLYNLSIRLGKSGRHVEALTSSQEACTTYRELYRTRPVRFCGDFKISLQQTSLRLKSLGCDEEAQAFDAEAATISLS